MKKQILLLLTALALILTACAQSTTQPAETESATQPPTEVPVKQEPATQVASQPEPAADDEPGCTVIGPKPTPDPTLQAILPPPGENDWIKGPEDAYVTLVEYGDFQ
jgi:hypothetical protein